MIGQSDFNFVASISALRDEHRLRFYETLTHRLTIAIRVVRDDSTRSDADKVNAIHCIKEILHRVTSKIALIRRHLREWTESDLWGEIRQIRAISPPMRQAHSLTEPDVSDEALTSASQR